MFKTRILPALVLVTGLFGCSSNKEEKPVLTPDVQYVTAAQRTVPVYTEYVGQTLGISDVEIRSRVEGWVMSIHFKEGDRVQKGQLLYVIDDQPIRTKIDAAEARLAETKTMMTKAKADLDRVEPLARMNALSQRDLDAARANYEAARNEVDVADAQLRNARLELSYTRILAPIGGIIGISDVQVGDFVNGSGMGKPINTISSTGTVRVRFPVSENEYLLFQARKRADSSRVTSLSEIPVYLVLSDGSRYAEAGRLDLANRQVDAATGSLLLQAVFQNNQGLIRPGQYVKVRFQTDEYQNAVLVPQQTVNQVQSLFQVFVLNDSNKVAPRVVQPGPRVGSNWIITSGLKAGEKVALVGSASIQPQVTVKPSAMPWNFDSTLPQ
ncbi:MAG: efflux RND transporter periplasmic adaptor subunit [Chitinophagaceae bacterium]|nr:efflux RND transporter periplasmic adaptor subunit [Chitinophagaceae bacterium]